MLMAVNGYYENGKVYLKEIPQFSDKTDVIVTFLCSESEKNKIQQKRILGALEGKIKIPDDFNKPIDDLNDYM